MKKLSAIFLLALCSIVSYGGENSCKPDFSLEFARYDEGNLKMDVYMPSDTLSKHLCIMYAYGGGFKNNNQSDPWTAGYCRRLADDGFVAIAIDYRLGLKGARMKSKVGMIKPLRNSIQMASEDMFKAVSFVLDNCGTLKVDPEGIILCGSSAGAITVLQTDYELCNRSAISEVLPAHFRFAGVVSFSGAVFSSQGRCAYRYRGPSPTLMLHGIDDEVVPYDKIAFFSTRFSGSNDLVKTFKRNHYPHGIIRFVSEGHGVAMREMECYDEMMWFIENMVIGGRHFEIDKTVFDRDHKRTKWDKAKTKSLY